MRVRLLSLTILFAWIGVTSAADISRSFDVEPGGTLDIDSDVGSIEVTPGADDKVTLATDWETGQSEAIFTIERDLGDEKWTVEFRKE